MGFANLPSPGQLEKMIHLTEQEGGAGNTSQLTRPCSLSWQGLESPWNLAAKALRLAKFCKERSNLQDREKEELRQLPEKNKRSLQL